MGGSVDAMSEVLDEVLALRAVNAELKAEIQRLSMTHCFQSPSGHHLWHGWCHYCDVAIPNPPPLKRTIL